MPRFVARMPTPDTINSDNGEVITVYRDDAPSYSYWKKKEEAEPGPDTTFETLDLPAIIDIPGYSTDTQNSLTVGLVCVIVVGLMIVWGANGFAKRQAKKRKRPSRIHYVKDSRDWEEL